MLSFALRHLSSNLPRNSSAELILLLCISPYDPPFPFFSGWARLLCREADELSIRSSELLQVDREEEDVICHGLGRECAEPIISVTLDVLAV